MTQADIVDFIDQAPDGEKSPKRTERKYSIPVSIAPVVLDRLDDWARGKGISRAAAKLKWHFVPLSFMCYFVYLMR